MPCSARAGPCIVVQPMTTELPALLPYEPWMQLPLQDSARNGANIVVLPEMWNCPYSNDSFPTYAEDIDSGASPSTEALQRAAQSCGVVVVGGSVPERRGDKLYNTCCIFDADGALLGKHRCAAWLLPTGRGSNLQVVCPCRQRHKDGRMQWVIWSCNHMWQSQPPLTPL